MPSAKTAGETLLLVEDDEPLANVMKLSLGARGYDVAPAPTGEAALTGVAKLAPALILLDLALPDIDGIDLCRELRRLTAAPIIVVSADHDEGRKILALDEGADDYVTKPFSMPELSARIRAALRHRRSRPVVDDTELDVGSLHIDVGRHTVTLPGRQIELTPKEFDLLAFLARHAGKVVTHRVLLTGVWGPEAADQVAYLRVFVRQLRQKLGNDPDGARVVTQPGVGYSLVDPSA